jgi:hypothetical protein
LSVPGAKDTEAFGISGNNIVGEYDNASGEYGFLYNGSSYTTLSVPGASDTEADGISGNNIVGFYYNGVGNEQGFLYDINSQTYTTLSVPGAVKTFAQGISGSDIVGYYAGGNGTPQSFLATPVPEPSALGLLSSVGVAALWLRRRRK